MIIEFFKDLWSEFKDYILPFVIIHEYERGVRLRFGKYPKELQPGLRFKLPFVDVLYTCTVTEDTKHTLPIFITTSDEKTITATPFIRFEIKDSIKYLIYSNTADSNLHDIARLVFSDVLTDCTWEECKKKSTKTLIKNKLKEKCEPLGIEILECGLSGLAIVKLIITKVE